MPLVVSSGAALSKRTTNSKGNPPKTSCPVLEGGEHSFHSVVRGPQLDLQEVIQHRSPDSAYNWFSICIVRSHMGLTFSVTSTQPPHRGNCQEKPKAPDRRRRPLPHSQDSEPQTHPQV